MKTIGFNFTTSAIYFVAVEGTLNNPNLLLKNKILLPENHSVSELTEWFKSEISAILNNVNPDKVSYRLTINNVSNKYVFHVYYGQAILNLICNNKKIDIIHTSPASITVGKFNQPKDTNLQDYVDNVLGTHPPYWNKDMRNSALISILQL